MCQALREAAALQDTSCASHGCCWLRGQQTSPHHIQAAPIGCKGMQAGWWNLFFCRMRVTMQSLFKRPGLLSCWVSNPSLTGVSPPRGTAATTPLTTCFPLKVLGKASSSPGGCCNLVLLVEYLPSAQGVSFTFQSSLSSSGRAEGNTARCITMFRSTITTAL